MKFVVSTVGKIPGRLGYFIQSESGKQYHTPLLIQSTKSGSVPYLSREVFNYVTKDEQIMHINLATTEHMAEALEAYKKGISSYVGYENYPSFLSLRDPYEVAPSGYHEKNFMPLFTRRGKVKITAEKYMNFVETFKPDMYHTLCDSDTNFDSTKKRITKSVDRTEKFFQACLNLHKNSENLKKCFLFAPIVGGYNKEARTKCIKSLSHSDIDGYLIEGLHNYGVEALNVKEDAVKEIVSHCLQQIDIEYHEKPRMMLGAFNPLIVLELIALGIDVFDTSYVYLNAINSKALTFSFDIKENIENRKFTTDMSDIKFKMDLAPVLENCECLTCRKHKRAYIYHLIEVKELLGPILLMIHNTHHYLKYFETIRQLITEGELSKLIEHIKNQMSIDENDAIQNSQQDSNLNAEKLKEEDKQDVQQEESESEQEQNTMKKDV